MRTRNKLTGTFTGLLAVATVFGQSNLYYDGVDLAKMKRQDALPLSSAMNLYNYREAKRNTLPTDSASFRNMSRSTAIPANMEEIYYSNNWLEVAKYSWLKPELFEYYGNDLYEADYLITDRKKGDLKFWLRSWHDGKIEPYIDVTTPFSNIPYKFGKRGNYTYRYYENAGKDHESDYNVIVSYSNGILILELTHSGQVGDFNTHRRFRKAYIAVPKSLMHEQPNTTAGTMYAPGNAVSPPTPGQLQGYAPVQPLLSFNEGQLVGGDAAENLRDAFYTYRVAMPDAASLKNMRADQPVHPSLEYDLYDLDWMELGRYEGFNGERYIVNDRAMDVLRFHPQAGTYRFSLTVPAKNSNAQLRYLNNWNRQATTVYREGPFTYLAADNKPVMTVVSYSNNILVVDAKEQVSGSVYRVVYFGVAKQF